MIRNGDAAVIEAGVGGPLVVNIEAGRAPGTPVSLPFTCWPWTGLSAFFLTASPELRSPKAAWGHH